MNGMRRGTLPLQLWLAIALVAIVGVPAATSWALSSALTRHPAQDDLALAAVSDILGHDQARWHNPAWQHDTQKRLGALHADVLLDDPTGHPIFATAGVPALLHWWIGRIGQLYPSGAFRSARVVFSTPPRLLTTLPIFSDIRSGSSQASPGHVGTAAVLVGVASVWLVPAPLPPGPPTWLVPVATLAALLATLAVVVWGLGRLVLGPLAAMSRAANQIAGGNLNVHLPASRAREVAEVAAALAGMSAGLQSALQRQSELEEERRLFIGAIAHDLHTPLFVLRGYLQGLESGVAATPQRVAAYIAECRARVDALARLISDLFAYTKVEYLDWTPQQEPVELGELLRHTTAGMQSLAAEKEIVLELDGPDAPSPLMGDRQLLTRAIENLLDNALRYTPAGGEIAVSWGAENDHFVVRIADTGPGIAAEDLPHLFTPLYRGETSRNRETGGTGLGLTIARRILQAHGGNLIAANRPTGGAIFTATLPQQSNLHPALNTAAR